jgi:hypothetical protein
MEDATIDEYFVSNEQKIAYRYSEIPKKYLFNQKFWLRARIPIFRRNSIIITVIREELPYWDLALNVE